MGDHVAQGQVAQALVSLPSLHEALQDALSQCRYGTDFIVGKQSVSKLQRLVERRLLKDAREKSSPKREGLRPGLICEIVTNGVQAIAQDTFWECFETPYQRPWNWSFSLWVMWAIGCVIRYGILFPIRAVTFILMIVLSIALIMITSLLIPSKRLLFKVQRRIIQMAYAMTLFSIGAVVHVHGTIPETRTGQIYVANHTTLFDYIIVSAIKNVTTVGQRYDGLLGIIEEWILGCLQPLWFNRMDKDERKKVSDDIRKHVFSEEANLPLLLFPEGVLVNNRFAIMFKKSAFEIGAEVCPVAIKYNESLSPQAYWNSREKSFVSYLFSVMSSWALVVDVWFLPPEHIGPDETPEEFAERTKLNIARTAGLIPRSWDGYLKYITVSDRLQARKRLELMYDLGLVDHELNPREDESEPISDVSKQMPTPNVQLV
ncbi:Lysophosphatidic acid acyltransferase/Glycerol-3-phosphate 1-O-acyltransferase [Giardia muris]|uniref:Lysophosphatidic acid acyltransferase/Glycerol-3-phosphate 1-O-acyltransferase n=1 Tax=Giardia muris TaxID=5742 RepID=A0A4Z1T9L0_GIAMU|nr:Lysophosphatidic acid acyltransferase/Glycerol-3-phosphate 1-O-acyltransferase [Giardia muris]|eukprot:TNJ29209.1 Lysophosphatidic acid acyltransferase/Glycerol-3-phosphate 1-O-acyltransferase [Giardia muris]